MVAPVLVAGRWGVQDYDDRFEATNPVTGDLLDVYPVSTWPVVNRVLDAGVEAFEAMKSMGPEVWADFLEGYGKSIEDSATELASIADRETALGATPRFLEVEIPRTIDQLRQASRAARARSWKQAVISPDARIGSMLAPIPGPVLVMGPNNFPFAFNSVSGGDAAAALATGHPVIAKANPGHPGTTRRLAELASEAVRQAGLHDATVQLIYHLDNRDGESLVADSRLAATAYTGSKSGGLALKGAAEAAGALIYLEMSSVNPVVILADALEESLEEIAEELSDSMLAGCGQFCTSPGLVFLMSGSNDDLFVEQLKQRIGSRPSGTLLSGRVKEGLESVRAEWRDAGAVILVEADAGEGNCFPNTLIEISGQTFLMSPDLFQREAFGNMSLVVRCNGSTQLLQSLAQLHGNLTGTVFGRGKCDGSGPSVADVIAALRPRVGRLIVDKVPTGVAVVDAMNHGGPFPSTGHPGFTAVGIPASLARFGMLQCYDNVPDHLLPPELQASNPLGLQRRVDGIWTSESIEWG